MKKVFLVGTSHIAKDSVLHVSNAIKEHNPDVVCVELDRMRYQGLVAEYVKKEKPAKGFSLYNMRKVGFKGFLFALFGSWGTRKLAGHIGTNPGEEMLSAVKVGQEHGKKVALIDQDINITLSRLSKAFTMREVGRILLDMLRGIVNPKGEMKRMGFEPFDLNTVPSEEMIEKMMDYMSSRYPGIFKVLVHERNVFMSKKIMKIMQLEGMDTMVVVVGAGHKKGMARILESQVKSDFNVVLI